MNKRIGNFEFRKSYPLARKWEKPNPYYEIVKYYLNPLYKKEDEYDQNDGEFYFKSENPHHRIHQNCFKNPESCYTVATFIYDKNEPCWDLKSISSRIIDCETEEELKDLFSVIKYGFNILEKLNDEEDC